MDSVDFLKILAGKLPPAMQHKWISRVGAIRDVEHRDTSLIDLATFVSREARNQNAYMKQCVLLVLHMHCTQFTHIN